MQHFRKCLSMGMELGDASAITASLYGLVNVCLRSGGWREAEGIYGQVLDKLRLGDIPPWPQCSAPGATSRPTWASGTGCRYYQESLVLLDRLGDFYSTAVARNNLANISYRRGDWTAALENYAASLEGFEKAGDERSLASVLSNSAALHIKKGEWSRALQCYQESLALFERLEDQAGAAQVLANLSQLLPTRGERSLAKEQLSRALEKYRSIGDREAAAEMQANIDLLAKGGSEESPHLEECLSQITELKEAGDLSGQAEVLSLPVAGYHADRGRWDDCTFLLPREPAAFCGCRGDLQPGPDPLQYGPGL